MREEGGISVLAWMATWVSKRLLKIENTEEKMKFFKQNNSPFYF